MATLQVTRESAFSIGRSAANLRKMANNLDRRAMSLPLGSERDEAETARDDAHIEADRLEELAAVITGIRDEADIAAVAVARFMLADRECAEFFALGADLEEVRSINARVALAAAPNLLDQLCGPEVRGLIEKAALR